jgi:hypothetical protein
MDWFTSRAGEIYTELRTLPRGESAKQENSMPMLPSGRHIAINLVPLDDLFVNITEPGNVERILAIETVDGIYPYTEVMFLQPPERAGEPVTAPELRVGSQTPPEGMVLVPSGLRLSDWNVLTTSWSEADKASFQEFLATRARDLFQKGMDAVERVRKAVDDEKKRKTEELIRVLRTLPEEEWIKQLESKDWDDYDMLAALGVIEATVSENPEVYARHGQTFDRLCGMWSVVKDRLVFPQESISPEDNARALARKWRAINDRDFGPVVSSWHDQLIIECVNLWNHAGQTLEDVCPGAFGILVMVTLSPEGTASQAQSNGLNSRQEAH